MEVLALDVIGWKTIVNYNAVQRSGFALFTWLKFPDSVKYSVFRYQLELSPYCSINAHFRLPFKCISFLN